MTEEADNREPNPNGSVPEGEDRDKRTRECPRCGGEMILGELSQTANFGVTKNLHFVTEYGLFDVRYERATEVESWMCLNCGNIDLFAQNPLSVLDPIQRKKKIEEDFPEVAEERRKEESRRKEREEVEQDTPSESDEHIGV